MDGREGGRERGREGGGRQARVRVEFHLHSVSILRRNVPLNNYNRS